MVCASHEFPNQRWQVDAERLTAGIVDTIERDGWRCPAPLGVESPGLMTGYVGIGYQLLRLAFPEKLPSVLTLEPPKLRPDALIGRKRASHVCGNATR